MKKALSFLLALILTAGIFLPTRARAAGNDPLVMASGKTRSGEVLYYYDENGLCIRQEWPSRNMYTRFEYNDSGRLWMEETIHKDRLESRIFYDVQGKPVAEWFADQDGQLICSKESTLEYDAYGRITFRNEYNPEYPENPVTQVRYEYYNDPVSLFFGTWEQDGNTRNGPEPIEWLILDTDEDGLCVLLVSKNALDSRKFHNKAEAVTWKDCDLRKWLNEEFAYTAFTGTQYQMIQPTVSAPGVYDTVFLPDLEMVEQYFPREADRLCTATPYAVRQGAYVNKKTGGSWWLLQTSAKDPTAVMSINSDGVIDYDGGNVESPKGTVRPAMWVNRNALNGQTGSASRIHQNIFYTDPDSGEKIYITSTLYTYDDAGRLICQQEYVTGDMLTWDYDEYGNLVQYKQMYPDTVIAEDYTHTYNRSGVLTKTHFLCTENGKTEAEGDIRYDSAGRQTRLERQESDGSVTVTTWKYNKNGDVTATETRLNGKITATESRKYDRHGNLLEVIRNGNTVETYTYAPLSQLQG